MVRILGRKGFRESEFRVKKFGDSSELAGFQQSKFLKGGKSLVMPLQKSADFKIITVLSEISINLVLLNPPYLNHA